MARRIRPTRNVANVVPGVGVVGAGVGVVVVVVAALTLALAALPLARAADAPKRVECPPEAKMFAAGLAGGSLALDGATPVPLPVSLNRHMRGAFTIEMWARKTTPAARFLPLLSRHAHKGVANNKLADLDLYLNQNSRVAFLMGDGVSLGMLLQNGASPPVLLNHWFHVAVTFDEKQHAALYLNGALVASSNWQSPGKKRQFDACVDDAGKPMPYMLGEYTNQDPKPQFWQGLVDDVRLWSVARTEVEVRRARYSIVDAASDNLVALYLFDEQQDAEPDPPSAAASDGEAQDQNARRRQWRRLVDTSGGDSMQRTDDAWMPASANRCIGAPHNAEVRVVLGSWDNLINLPFTDMRRPTARATSPLQLFITRLPSAEHGGFLSNSPGFHITERRPLVVLQRNDADDGGTSVSSAQMVHRRLFAPSVFYSNDASAAVRARTDAEEHFEYVVWDAETLNTAEWLDSDESDREHARVIVHLVDPNRDDTRVSGHSCDTWCQHWIDTRLVPDVASTATTSSRHVDSSSLSPSHRATFSGRRDAENATAATAVDGNERDERDERDKRAAYERDVLGWR